MAFDQRENMFIGLQKNDQRKIKRPLWILVGTTLIALLMGASSARRVTTKDHLSNVQIKSLPDEWKLYLDPSKDDFWREGNHIPDQGFLLWAKNPTKENARLYLIRMNMKRNLLHLMYAQQKEANIALIKEGVIADDYDFLSKEVKKPNKSTFNIAKELADTHIFFFFSETCPHSRRQAEVLRGLQNVTPLQVNGKKLFNFEDLPETLWAEKEDVEKHNVKNSVPVLLIYNNKTNKMLRLIGFQTMDSLIKASKEVKK